MGHARLGITTFNKMKATVLYLLAFERVPLPLHFMQSVGKTKSGKTFEKENWSSAALPITATVFFSVYLINLRVCEEPHVYHTDRRVIRRGPRVKYCSLALQIYNRDKNLAKKLTSARHYSEVGWTVTKLLRILGHEKSTKSGWLLCPSTRFPRLFKPPRTID